MRLQTSLLRHMPDFFNHNHLFHLKSAWNGSCNSLFFPVVTYIWVKRLLKQEKCRAGLDFVNLELIGVFDHCVGHLLLLISCEWQVITLLQSTSSLHSDLPPSNQQLMDRTKFAQHIIIFRYFRYIATKALSQNLCQNALNSMSEVSQATVLHKPQKRETRVSRYIEFYGSKALRDLLKPWCGHVKGF